MCLLVLFKRALVRTGIRGLSEQSHRVRQGPLQHRTTLANGSSAALSSSTHKQARAHTVSDTISILGQQNYHLMFLFCSCDKRDAKGTPSHAHTHTHTSSPHPPHTPPPQPPNNPQNPTLLCTDTERSVVRREEQRRGGGAQVKKKTSIL